MHAKFWNKRWAWCIGTKTESYTYQACQRCELKRETLQTGAVCLPPSSRANSGRTNATQQKLWWLCTERCPIRWERERKIKTAHGRSRHAHTSILTKSIKRNESVWIAHHRQSTIRRAAWNSRSCSKSGSKRKAIGRMALYAWFPKLQSFHDLRQKSCATPTALYGTKHAVHT